MRGNEVEGVAVHFYRRLLDLNEVGEPVLGEVLEALLGLTGAREAFIEVRDGDRRWNASHGCEPNRIEEIRESVSTGIIAHALDAGEVVTTASAVSDPRFDELESVRRNGIEAVLCAPLGADASLGVVYLQGGQLGHDTTAAKRHVRYFARAFGPLADRLLADTGGPSSPAFRPVLHASRVMADVVQRCRFAAALEVQVLLTGPTGTGKTLLAECMHRASPRSEAPFVALNCAAIPEALLENELFGAGTGGHSAASGGVTGKVAAAEGGTLLLDEVGELSLPAQAKLLQLLQSRTYHRLGDPALHEADVRILAATNQDLEQAVAEGRFRADLLYRLDVLHIRVPPLEEREEDIVPLALSLLRRAADRNGLEPKRLSSEARGALLARSWPGNVRELANRLEAALVNAHLREGAAIGVEDLQLSEPEPAGDATGWAEATRRFQRRHLLSVLEDSQWNVSEAARRLSITRAHVYNLMRDHGIDRR
jgi:Nif-specific regulatory protein